VNQREKNTQIQHGVEGQNERISLGWKHIDISMPREKSGTSIDRDPREEDFDLPDRYCRLRKESKKKIERFILR